MTSCGALRPLLLAAACATVLAGCGQQAKAPSGQVVASVDGEEITQRELRAELGDVPAGADARARRAAEQQALQAIINRKILAHAAKEQKIDKSADFALQKQRAEEMALVQALQSNVARQVPPATQEAAEAFMLDFPDSFSERKIFIVDQVRLQRPTDPALMKRLEPLNSLAEVEAVLASAGVPYERTTDRLDGGNSDPVAIKQIAHMPAGAVFAIPRGDMLLLNTIRETQVKPLTGPAAVKIAQERLRQRQVQDALARNMKGIIDKAKDRVVYNQAYQPPAKAPSAAKAGA